MAFNLVRYSQQDPLWKNNKLANGPDTIGFMGCALTSLAMYSSGWGLTETPATLNLKLRANGGYVEEALVWSAITKFHPELKNTGLTLCMNTDAPLAKIDASLAAGNPVIVEVDFSPTAGLQTHWVLLYGKKQGDYLMQDPWPAPAETEPVTLLSRFAQGKPLVRAIKAVAWYEYKPGGSTPSTPSTPETPATPLPEPVVTDLYLDVRPTATAGIKLRRAPSFEALADYAEMPGMRLHVIEEKAGALDKLGRMNEWIYVRDPNGHRGYVAAWFVQIAPTAPPTTPSPAPAPTPAPIPTPPVPSTPPASEPKRMQVVVNESVGKYGLSVREEPSPGATRINIEQVGARLTVIEPPDSALAKIGKAGQWLAIKATNNKRGYVMAQYVHLKD